MARLAGLIGAAALSLGLALPGPARAEDPVKPAAGDPVKPDLGAGPHRDNSSRQSGEGERPRQEVPPPAVVPTAPDAKERQGGASAGPSTPEDERLKRDREDDERKATESKEKMKKRPGYKDEAPGPRALYRI